MTQTPESPRIRNASWGRLEVEGQDHAFKDAKLFPGGAREWDWNETGTSHTPGIQPADVEELLEKGAMEIVLARGFDERLQVCAETLDMLAERDIPVHVLQTEKAVQRYNELCSRMAAGALVHSTC